MADEIERASRLPLKDAAYLLWPQRYCLDRSGNPPPTPTGQPSNLNNSGVFQRFIRQAFARIQFERDNAHEGPTFHRLKKAHPEAKDRDLQQAIRLAVKLDVDSVKNFTYDVESNVNPVDRAVELTRRGHPGFLESTYKALWHELAIAMR